MLTNEQIEKRRKGIGGSDARTIMYGDHEDWQALYNEKIHGTKPTFTAQQKLFMAMGHAIEPLCLEKFAAEVKPLQKPKSTDPVAQMRYWAADPFFFFSPDGITTDSHSVQCKFHTGDKSIIELAEFYAPQLLHEMLCMMRKKADRKSVV